MSRIPVTEVLMSMLARLGYSLVMADSLQEPSAESAVITANENQRSEFESSDELSPKEMNASAAAELEICCGDAESTQEINPPYPGAVTIASAYDNQPSSSELEICFGDGESTQEINPPYPGIAVENQKESINTPGGSTTGAKSANPPAIRRKRCVSGLVWKCLHCPKKFQNQSSLRQHSICHYTERPFVCNDDSGCTKSYKSASALNRHRLDVHSGIEFKCKACNKKFSQKQTLKCHTKRHVESGNPQFFPCEQAGCFEAFLTKADFDSHSLTHHDPLNMN